MKIKPWDPNKKHRIGDTALIYGVESEVISIEPLRKLESVCHLCPIHKIVKSGAYSIREQNAPDGCQGCEESLSTVTVWAGRDALLMARLKGEI